MQQAREIFNQLTSLQYEDGSIKDLMENFSSDYIAALESDCEHNPAIDANYIATEFLSVIKKSFTGAEEGRFKENLSRDDVKALIVDLVQRSNCNPCRCSTGDVAAEKVALILEKTLPVF